MYGCFQIRCFATISFYFFNCKYPLFDRSYSPRSTGYSNRNMSFFLKIEKRVATINSHLCVGLDPHIKELFPEEEGDKIGKQPTEEEKCDAAYTFCKTIIDKTGKCFMS